MKRIKISEISYKDYRSDDSKTTKAKINNAVTEINRKLFEAERFLRQNNKLREEENVDTNQYWKSTARKLVKMNERIKSIQETISKMGLNEIMENIDKEDTNKKIDFILACSYEDKNTNKKYSEEQLRKLTKVQLDKVFINRFNDPNYKSIVDKFKIKK